MQGKLQGEFFGKLRLEYIDGRTWRVNNPAGPELFGFRLKDGREIVPPDGFLTDFASIPRPLWRILPPVGDGKGGKYGFGAVIHDFIFQTGKILGLPVSCGYANEVFRACNVAVEVDGWRIWVMDTGLQLGSWRTWNKYRNKNMRGRK